MAPRDEILTADQVTDRLKRTPGWAGDATGIARTYTVDYDTAIRIVSEIGAVAIELEHRPDIDIRWGQLRVAMTTHTAGDQVTELDLLLVDRIDAIAAGHGAEPV